MSEIISRESKFLKSIKVEDVDETTYVNYDPLYLGINYSYRDHQSVIIV